MEGKKLLRVIVLIIGTIFIAGFSLTIEAAETQKALPKVINISTYRVGSIAYLISQGFANAIKQKTGMEVRLISTATDVGKFMSAANKESELGYTAASDCYLAARGISGWEKVGLSKVRLIWAGTYAYGTLGVRRDSDIKTLKDLKGKVIATWRGAEEKHVHSSLAFAGLEPTDVKYLMLTYPETCKAVIDGKADAAYWAPQAPIALEAENSPGGLRLLEYGPPEEKEAWTRFRKYAPYYFAYRATRGAYISKNPTWMFCTRQVLFSMDFVPEDLIYTIVKALDEGFDIYKDVGKPDSADWTLRETLEAGGKGSYNPWHPGFVKYAKEKGIWTDAHEKLQKQFLKEEEEIIKASKK